MLSLMQLTQVEQVQAGFNCVVKIELHLFDSLRISPAVRVLIKDLDSRRVVTCLLLKCLSILGCGLSRLECLDYDFIVEMIKHKYVCYICMRNVHYELY